MPRTRHQNKNTPEYQEMRKKQRLGDSSKNKERNHKYYLLNSDKIKDRVKRHRIEHKNEYLEINKNSRLKKIYGITLEEYKKLLSLQNNVCAICFRPSDDKRDLSVDHNHETGKIRGLLCRNCNLGLGLLGDNKQMLLRACTYLDVND